MRLRFKRCLTLYQLANRDEKREMLKLVFSNFIWDGNSLDFNLLSPFDLLFECKQSKVWLTTIEEVITAIKLDLRGVHSTNIN